MQHEYFNKLLREHPFLTNDKKCFSTSHILYKKSTALELYFHLTNIDNTGTTRDKILLLRSRSSFHHL